MLVESSDQFRPLVESKDLVHKADDLAKKFGQVNGWKVSLRTSGNNFFKTVKKPGVSTNGKSEMRIEDYHEINPVEVVAHNLTKNNIASTVKESIS